MPVIDEFPPQLSLGVERERQGDRFLGEGVTATKHKEHGLSGGVARGREASQGNLPY